MRLKFGFGLARSGVLGVDEDIDLICVKSGDASDEVWIKAEEKKHT